MSSNSWKKEKKKSVQKEIGLLPNCLVNFFFFFFFVLQPCNCIARERAEKKNCIAIVLQEKGVVGWFVLQCEEYCKKKGICIAIQ